METKELELESEIRRLTFLYEGAKETYRKEINECDRLKKENERLEIGLTSALNLLKRKSRNNIILKIIVFISILSFISSLLIHNL